MSRIQRLRATLTQFPDIKAPPLWLLATEQRACWEYLAGLALYSPLKRAAPRGDGHPVLVIPGFGASDFSTSFMRQFLDGLGYATHPWGMGRNRGIKKSVPTAMEQLLQDIYEQSGQQKVSIIGQSLGGVFARELAKAAPHQVRQVITLGSPFSGHPLASSVTRIYEWISGDKLDNMNFDRHRDIRTKPPVPTTAVYSKLDGVVAWRCSIEDENPEAENIHLRGNTHCGMAVSPTALYLVAERLAQAPEQWKAFEPHGLGRVFYGAQDHLPAH